VQVWFPLKILLHLATQSPVSAKKGMHHQLVTIPSFQLTSRRIPSGPRVLFTGPYFQASGTAGKTNMPYVDGS
jgi:hypothetical protein